MKWFEALDINTKVETKDEYRMKNKVGHGEGSVTGEKIYHKYFHMYLSYRKVQLHSYLFTRAICA